MKKIKLGLLPQILIAIALGIAAGTVSPELPVRVFVTFNALFSQFLNFIIPLIIVGLVTPAIADIGKGAGKMLVATVLLAYGATLFSGFLSFGVGETFFPDLITRNIPLSEISEAKGVTPFFTVAIPEPLNVMTALVMAFTVGLGLAHLHVVFRKDGKQLLKAINDNSLNAIPAAYYMFHCVLVIADVEEYGAEYFVKQRNYPE
jgi:Na+/H+-dicarboxylate symporter